MFHVIYNHIFFIYTFTAGQLGCFHMLIITYKTAMNLRVHISFWISVFVFFSYITRSEIAGSCSSFIFSFCFLFFKKHHNVFHNDCTPTGHKIPFSLLPCYYFLFLIYLIITVLTSVRWYFTVALICISLIISDINHLFMSLTVICVFSLEICLFLCPF